jgi:hypothetical protein
MIATDTIIARLSCGRFASARDASAVIETLVDNLFHETEGRKL